ncbi:winged helix-turn-helix transcriptional regulator [Thermomonospora umbrina]|uniref:HxlR family transcriptional regulator n=1 Tax=Thermomonospora umbrina TaxID=111806 RepID=A0A3D9SRI0_9ACTN|nr:helix-turn-helix domain-containing protein [Thermomonospora umbrina]REE96563.1 HxlR family transcriptional regulator [Thermomonospora umbrina]
MEVQPPEGRLATGCGAREILDRIADKWSLYVISLLGERTLRFTELKRGIDGISQRMLTVTLRALERDGLVSRTVYPVMPPRVDYTLTDLGRTLLETVTTLVGWADRNLEAIEAARADYDTRAQALRALTEGLPD